VIVGGTLAAAAAVHDFIEEENIQENGNGELDDLCQQGGM